jgi:hypothetical protein
VVALYPYHWQWISLVVVQVECVKIKICLNGTEVDLTIYEAFNDDNGITQ